MFNLKKTSLFLLLFFLTSIQNLNAQGNVVLTGSWDLTLSQADLQDGAGSDFNHTYESAVDQVLVEIYRFYFIWGSGTRTWNWAIDVNKSDTDWDSSLEVWARRTGDGQCSYTYTITGGQTYQRITDITTEFFTGSITGSGSWFLFLLANNIPIQYQIRGVSATLIAKTYTTSIVYTVRDN